MKQILQSIAWLVRGCRDPDVILPNGTTMDYKLANELPTAAVSTPPIAPTDPYVRYIVSHPEMGLFVGVAMGFGFWSKLDPAGQRQVPAFESVEQCSSIMENMMGMHTTGFKYHCVKTKQDMYAEIPEIRRAEPPVPEDALEPLLPNQLH